MPVSCARCLNDFCCMCSNLALISSRFSSISTRRFINRFLVHKLPSGPDFLYKFMDVCCAWKSDPGKSMTKFSPTLSRGTIFHIRLIQKKHAVKQYIEPYPHTHKSNQYLTRCQTHLYCCVNNFSSSCCWILALSNAVPAGSREVTVAFRFISERAVQEKQEVTEQS
jgi:hypothetical protein